MTKVFFQGRWHEASDVYVTDGLVCEQHPDRSWPHDACGGPGCPDRHQQQTLSEALEFIRDKARNGVSFPAREWLDARGIAWEPADGVTDEEGQF